MATPLLLDLSHTSHTRARTGIQRVARSLRTALAADALPLTYDPYARGWRELQAWETANLQAEAPASKRGARWPWSARWRGAWKRWTGPRAAALPASSGLVVPELFSPTVAAALPALLGATSGPRIALFHDAIAFKYPELTPTKTVARYPGYLHELLQFDGIAAVSEDSRATLLDYWCWLGVTGAPPVATLPLGIDAPAAENAAVPPASDRPVVLSVGSIEGRKNHVALLEACQVLWDRGLSFELRLIGLANTETGRTALDRIATLKASGRPLRYDGAVDEATLSGAYASSLFTVYPSLSEGFGLPVLESLAHGRPCICSSRGALGEAARGGGCLTLDDVGRDSLASAIGLLLSDDSRRSALGAEATARRFRSWHDYAADLRTWMTTLPRRA